MDNIISTDNIGLTADSFNGHSFQFYREVEGKAMAFYPGEFANVRVMADPNGEFVFTVFSADGFRQEFHGFGSGFFRFRIPTESKELSFELFEPATGRREKKQFFTSGAHQPSF